MNWIIEAIVIHLVFLGSIFVIYFRSPIITDLHPQKDLKDPPAKRLVLMVTDGLRAESFFSNDCEYVPQIKNIFTHQGMLGISHTRVPTESRPGHIALIAGLYEDPSAVTKGWRENPVDFDTVFNRSEHSYAWGSHDVVSVFHKTVHDQKMTIFTYEEPHDFSGKNKTHILDTWVFTKVKEFISKNSNNLKEKSKLIFFLHLLGLDSAGHIYKPGSRLFNENLKVTDKGVQEIYAFFEEHFNDGKTAYVLTSDHGMTNKGSHGDGKPHETETPIVTWGAGVNYWKNTSYPSKHSFKEEVRIPIPLIEIEQADIAPLMSTLIGIAVPVNNFGKLPKHIIKSSREYLARAMLNNALQILAQYEQLFHKSKEGLFSNILPSFGKLTTSVIEENKILSKHYIANNIFENSIQLSEHIIELSLEGIEYYQTYFKRALLICISLSFFAWIYYLLTMLQGQVATNCLPKKEIFYAEISILTVILFFIIVQNIPFSIGFYITLPVICWGKVLLANNIWNPLTELRHQWFKLIPLVISIELMVVSFYHREVISGVLIVFTIFKNMSFRNVTHIKRKLYFEWILSSIVLCSFPFIPISWGLRNDKLFLIGVLALFIKLLLAWNSVNNKKIMVVFCLIGFGNCLLALRNYNKATGVNTTNIVLSWVLLGLAYFGPIMSDLQRRNRNICIFMYLSISYLHLSVSYEVLFFVVLSTNILSFVELEEEIKGKQIQDIIGAPELKKETSLTESFNISFSLLLLILLSFFGTGNIASISSFDPNVVRFFITTFSPFVIMGLIILKLIIPILLIVSALIGLAVQLKINESKIFMSLLLICDLMGLNFLFMVTNKGSWLEIGMSISHFVIIEVTILVLALMTFIAKPLIHYNLSRYSTKIIKLK